MVVEELTKPWLPDMVTVRPVTESDLDFIYSTFLRNLYYGSEFWKLVPQANFVKQYRPYLEKILATPETETTVLCLKEDEDVIIGYCIATQPNILHFVYVKKDWRQQGLSRLMLPSNLEKITHLTWLGRKIYMTKHHLEFDPFIAWR